MWVSVPKDKTGPDGPMSVFYGEAQAGGTIFLAQGGSVPLALLEEEDELGMLIDSSLMGKTIARPLPSRRYTMSSLAKQSWCLRVGFESF